MDLRERKGFSSDCTRKKREESIIDRQERDGVMTGVVTCVVDDGSIQKEDQHLIEAQREEKCLTRF
jgi:hypothetical protein